MRKESLKRRKENKLSPSYETEPCKVTACHGDQVVLKSPHGVEYKRDLQHVKPLVTPDVESSTEEEREPTDETPIPEPADHPPEGQVPQEATVTPRRSGRVSRPPRRLDDYVLYLAFEELFRKKKRP